MRRGAPMLVPAAAACLALSGCGEADREVVLGRVGGTPALVIEGAPQPTLPLRIGVRTRAAVKADAAGFVIRPGPDATRLAFSTGLRGPVRGGNVRFQVEALLDDDWRMLFDEARGAAGSGWRDHEISLTELGPLDALRFRAHAPAAAAPLYGSVLLLGPPARTDAEPPDVILIVLDTLDAASLGAFRGAPGVSPHIDAFLAEGFSFQRAYAQYGNTLVSHASLFSARYPIRHGVYAHAPRRLSESLVKGLAAAGYRTAAFTEGGFVGSAFGFSAGFDAYDDGAPARGGFIREGGAQETFGRAARWIESRRERFFLFVHTYEVHAPYLPFDASSHAFANRITPGDDRLFPADRQGVMILGHNRGTERLPARDMARLEALHAGELRDLDAVVRTFLDRIRALGRADRTIVALTADHGDQFGEADKLGHGDSLHNRVLHVPLAFQGPGVAAGTSDLAVQLVDVMPTLFDLLGLPEPDARDGRSLAPLLRGETQPPAPAFSEQLTARGECKRLGLPEDCPLRRFAVQTGRFKLERSELPRYERLVDLDADPGESHDVADAHPEVLERHRGMLDAYLAQRAGSEPAVFPQLDADTVGRLLDLGYAPPDSGSEPE